MMSGTSESMSALCRGALEAVRGTDVLLLNCAWGQHTEWLWGLAHDRQKRGPWVAAHPIHIIYAAAVSRAVGVRWPDSLLFDQALDYCMRAAEGKADVDYTLDVAYRPQRQLRLVGVE